LFTILPEITGNASTGRSRGILDLGSHGGPEGDALSRRNSIELKGNRIVDMKYQTIVVGCVLGGMALSGDAYAHPVNMVNQGVMMYSAVAGNNNNATAAQFPQTPSKVAGPSHFSFRHLVPSGNNSNSSEMI
jgi:hypothetical protein